jgi:transposase
LEQREVIRFLTPKALRASAVAAEFRLVDETEALALATVKKWCKRFAEGRTSLHDDPRCGRPLTNDLAEAISAMLKERPDFLCKFLYRHFRIAKGTCL